MALGKKHGVSGQMVWLLLKGKRFTTKKELAEDIAKTLRIAPIRLISPRLRKAYLKAWPELKSRAA